MLQPPSFFSVFFVPIKLTHIVHNYLHPISLLHAFWHKKKKKNNKPEKKIKTKKPGWQLVLVASFFFSFIIIIIIIILDHYVPYD